jgi:putative oxidoreductase
MVNKEEDISMIRRLGHLFLSGIFITGGFKAFLNPGYRVNPVAKAGIPEPKLAVEMNGLAMTIGGALLALNLAPKLAATILIGCLVPTTIVGHPFWSETDANTRNNQQVQFFKNLGLLGGLLIVLLEK